MTGLIKEVTVRAHGLFERDANMRFCVVGEFYSAPFFSRPQNKEGRMGLLLLLAASLLSS